MKCEGCDSLILSAIVLRHDYSYCSEVCAEMHQGALHQGLRQISQFSVLSDPDKQTIHEARRWLRYLWQQGFSPEVDAIEHDGIFETMRKLDDLYLRATTTEPQLSGESKL